MTSRTILALLASGSLALTGASLTGCNGDFDQPAPPDDQPAPAPAPDDPGTPGDPGEPGDPGAPPAGGGDDPY